jgi:hypothetical protein
MGVARKVISYIVSITLPLSGCITESGSLSGLNIGPQLSSFFDFTVDARVDESKPKLEVIIPVFDPAIPENSQEVTEKNIWPELRRAEANRFAYKLKQALENTGAFGAVRVTPDKKATGDLYLIGKIIKSDGEDVEIELAGIDISGEKWFSKSFDYTVKEEYYKNVRNKGKDAYDPLFENAAKYVASRLHSRTMETLSKTKQLTELRFGSNMSEDAFKKNMAVNDGRFVLASFPSDEDPMLKRTRAVRIRDQMFVDSLQDTYSSFSERMTDSYLIWQEQSFNELKAKREAEIEAAGKAIVGVLLIGLAVAAAAAGSRNNNYSTGTAQVTAGLLAGAGGVALLASSFRTSEEAKVHRNALEELGKSIDVELAPQVVSMEKETAKLTGTAKEQFAQWRKFLQQIYAQEKTPDANL